MTRFNKPKVPKTRDDVAEIAFLKALRYLGDDAVTAAKRLKEAGKSPKEIFRATEGEGRSGLFENAGDWMFQIPDELSIRPENWNQLAKLNTPTETTAGKLMKHNVFNWEPSLKDLPVKVITPKKNREYPGGGGYNNPDPKVPTDTLGKAELLPGHTDLMAGDRDSLRSLGAHEMQHALDQVQGRPQGSIQTNSDMTNAFNNLVHPRVKKYKDELTRMQQESGQSPMLWKMNNPEQSKYLEEASRLFVPRAGSKGKTSALHHFDRYLNVSGEGSARRIGADVDKGLDEIRAGEPWADIPGDIAPEEFQLVQEHYLHPGRPFRVSPEGDKTLKRLLSRGLIGGGATAATVGAAAAMEPPPEPRGSAEPADPVTVGKSNRLSHAPVDKKEAMRLRLAEAKARSAKADARGNVYGEYSTQPLSGKEAALETLKAIPTGLRSVAESTAGLGGDATMLPVLATYGAQQGLGWLADKYAPDTGAGNWLRESMQPAVDETIAWDEGNPLWNSEEVGAGLDMAQGLLPQGGQDWLKEWTEAEAGNNPFAKTAGLAIELGVDPLNLIGAKWLKGGKLLRR